jgi:predicted Zn-dependent peptidase
VDTKKTQALAEKYFGTIARQPDPKRPDLTEPPHTAERRSTIEDAQARLARVDISWIIPPANSPDSAALDVLSSILSTGRSARLNQSLVREKQLATQAFAGDPDTRGPGLYQIAAIVAPGKTPDAVETAIYDEIDKVKSGPVQGWEIEKAQNTFRRQQALAVTNSLQRAVELGEYALFYNDPNLINTRIDRIVKVGPADVQRVARTYLTKENRSVIISVPKAPAGRGGVQ